MALWFAPGTQLIIFTQLREAGTNDHPRGRRSSSGVSLSVGKAPLADESLMIVATLLFSMLKIL